jgi:hypothetical protein
MKILVEVVPREPPSEKARRRGVYGRNRFIAPSEFQVSFGHFRPVVWWRRGQNRPRLALYRKVNST